MRNSEYNYVISYDIREPKRLAKLHRYLKRHCFMLQESVYLFMGSNTGWKTIQAGIESSISKNEDDVRVYRLNKQCCFHFFGKTPWPEGIYFSDYPPFTFTPLDGVIGT